MYSVDIVVNFTNNSFREKSRLYGQRKAVYNGHVLTKSGQRYTYEITNARLGTTAVQQWRSWGSEL